MRKNEQKVKLRTNQPHKTFFKSFVFSEAVCLAFCKSVCFGYPFRNIQDKKSSSRQSLDLNVLLSVRQQNVRKSAHKTIFHLLTLKAMSFQRTDTKLFEVF